MRRRWSGWGGIWGCCWRGWLGGGGGGRLAAVELLSVAERRRVLSGFNATAHPVPVGLTLPGLLAGQVARTPDAAAVVFEDQRLSYAEFDAWVGRLAGWLVARGVGP